MIDLKPLLAEYIPPKVPFRESQLNMLVNFLDNNTGIIVVRGSSGLGKTLLFKKAMAASEKAASLFSYISVHRFSSYKQMLREICYRFSSFDFTSHLSIKNALYNIKKRMDYSNVDKLVLFLDDCLSMSDLNKTVNLIQYLTRNNIDTVFFISTRIKSIKLIEIIRNIRNINEKHIMDLPRYTSKELKIIFEYRFRLTNCPAEYVESQVFNYLADIVYRYFYSNVTIGLALIYRAVQEVLYKNISKISSQVVENLLRHHFNPM